MASRNPDLQWSREKVIPPLILIQFTVSITDAKADFQRLVRRVRRGRIASITLHGKPCAYLISDRDYRQLILRIAMLNAARSEPRRASKKKRPPTSRRLASSRVHDDEKPD